MQKFDFILMTIIKSLLENKLSKSFILTLVMGFALYGVVEGPLAEEKKEEPVSGYFFLDQSVRELQDDYFLNPGSFFVDLGEKLWVKNVGGSKLSCSSCHGSAEQSMRGVAAKYPIYDLKSHKLVNLEQKINQMLVEQMQASPLAYESRDLLSLTSYIARQSSGIPLQVKRAPEAENLYSAGREFFHTRRGQLNLSCANCHEDLVGQKLRGDKISQGQINGFPMYRLMWQDMTSRHRMFEWCNSSLRAEPYPLGSPEYLALEYFLAIRGNGLSYESPSVRR